jgi:hypothetical protein
MGDDLIGDTACIAAHTSCIEIYTPMEPLWSGSLYWWGWGWRWFFSRFVGGLTDLRLWERHPWADEKP